MLYYARLVFDVSMQCETDRAFVFDIGIKLEWSNS